MIDNGTQLTCGSCKHFKKGAPDPNNIGAPCQGDCREGPPTPCMVLTPSPRGPVMQKITTYPQVHEQFEACGKYKPALVKAGAIQCD